MRNKLVYNQRQAAHLVVSIEDAILELEMFKYKAQGAISIIEDVCQEMTDPEIDPRDQWRYDLLQGLIQHLKQVHNLG